MKAGSGAHIYAYLAGRSNRQQRQWAQDSNRFVRICDVVPTNSAHINVYLSDCAAGAQQQGVANRASCWAGRQRSLLPSLLCALFRQRP